MTERYVIPYDRDFGQFSFREFNYAIHERTFRLAGNNATIGFNPYVSFPQSDTHSSRNSLADINAWRSSRWACAPRSLENAGPFFAIEENSVLLPDG